MISEHELFFMLNLSINQEIRDHLKIQGINKTAF
jgi:hypothetical protein